MMQRQIGHIGTHMCPCCGRMPRAYVTEAHNRPLLYHIECSWCRINTVRLRSLSAAEQEWVRVHDVKTADSKGAA